MELPNSEIITAIYRLLPGFVSAWIFYGFTPHAKKDAFERVIQALIFTLLAEFCVQCLSFVFHFTGRLVSVGVWDENVAFFWRVLVAILIGLLATVLANTNWLQDVKGTSLEKWIPNWWKNGFPSWFTKKNTYPSEWYSAFRRSRGFVFLNLTGGRRLYGWVEEFPDTPNAGHFSLLMPEWVLDDHSHLSLPVIERMLINACEVEMVEFKRVEELTTAEQQLNLANIQRIIEHRRKIEQSNESSGFANSEGKAHE